MRISDINNWTTCEVMALRDPQEPARVAVAAWVGTLAHAMLLGGDAEPPARIRFDATTPSMHKATMQAMDIARAAYCLLQYHGWEVIETERVLSNARDTGHLDVLAWRAQFKDLAIIDLKTGRGVGAGWLQVGGYLALKAYFNHSREIYFTPQWGGILHVPRSKAESMAGTLTVRPADDLLGAWHRRRERIEAVLNGEDPLPTPGLHCSRCTVANCPVRVG